MRTHSPNFACSKVRAVQVLWGQSAVEQTAPIIILCLGKLGTTREKSKG